MKRETSTGMGVIMVGSLTPLITGTSILLAQLAADLKERDDIRPVVIDTGGIRYNGLKGVRKYFGVLGAIWAEAGGAQVVSLHLNATAIALIGPVVLAMCRLRRRPLLIRLFGGNGYDELHGVQRAVAKWVMRASNLCLVETHLLEEQFKRDGITRVAWYSNSRPISPTDTLTVPGACSRFVFIGRICEEKGVEVLIEAGDRFGDGVVTDVYGPFSGTTLSEAVFAGRRNVRHRGSLPPDQVLDTLRTYDALLLPTWHQDEGYPGNIIEAFSVGRPVICTRWRALPEMVDDTCGLMVEPHDAGQLHAAMKRLVDDPELYQRLCRGAWDKRAQYSNVTWAQRFVDICQDLAS